MSPQRPPTGLAKVGHLPTRILVVDDERATLDLLHTWLARRGYEVWAASDGFEAIALARDTAFDVVITDLKMPGLDGLQVLSFFKSLSPATEVIVVSGKGSIDDAIVALRRGRAFDFLRKPLRSMQEVGLAVESALARRQAGGALPVPIGPSAAAMSTSDAGLTERERTIIALLAEGLENREIATRLCLSLKTVKNNLTQIYHKLGVKRRTQAVVSCQRHGLL